MLTLRLQLRRLSTFAFVAVFALALLPTVSRLLAHASGTDAWGQVCTPRGLQITAGGSGSAPAAAHLDHCPLCAVASAALVPPAAPAAWVPPGAALAAARLPRVAFHPISTWAPGRPRGPPAAA